MPNWDAIRKEWETTKITLADLAEKHGVKLGTLKSRKSRDKWSRDAPKKDATKNEKVATSENKVATPKQNKELPREVVIENDELTDKQRLFCIYYVKSFNATQSAIKAGYAPESAHVEGSRLLRNAKVSKEIKRIKQEMASDLYIEAMDVLQKWVKIAFADITDYVTFGKKEVPVVGMFGPLKDEDGNQITQEVNYVDLKESTLIDGTIVTEVKQGKDGISIKLADKMKALEFLTKYMDLLSEKDRKKLQEEKLKMEIERAKAEVKTLNKTENKGPITIIYDYGDDAE